MLEGKKVTVAICGWRLVQILPIRVLSIIIYHKPYFRYERFVFQMIEKRMWVKFLQLLDAEIPNATKFIMAK